MRRAFAVVTPAAFVAALLLSVSGIPLAPTPTASVSVTAPSSAPARDSAPGPTTSVAAAPTTAVTTTTVNGWAAGGAALRSAVRYAAAGARAADPVEVTQHHPLPVAQVAPAPGPTTCATPRPLTVPAVMGCLKACESGNYAEASHPWDGSGAYQFIPSTWRAWSARAGHPGYAFAYQAPPAVQDAVVVYVLTHGGAGNWSPRYGNNPCTIGWGG